MSILNMRDKAVKELIEQGVSFMDGLVQISPRVSGVWETENSPYDEKVHKRTVDLVPTADLRNALDEIGVNVLGAKEETARVPKEVPEGAVTVIVRTKLTGSNKTLKEVREMIFKLPCTAKIQAPSPLG